MGPGRKNGPELIGVDDDFDCRLYRRMKRRSIANKSSSRDVCVMEDNVAAMAVPGTGKLIAIDDDEDNDYKTYLDLKALGVPGYVDHGDGRYDDVDNNNNVDRSSGYVARDYGFGDSRCADYGNDDAGSDISTDPEYKVFLNNARMEGFMTVFCIGNVVIRYNSSEDDGEHSSQKKTCDFRTVNTEANRSSKGFQKRGRTSMVGDGNIAAKSVHPMDNHCLATSRSKSKVMGSNKQENKSGMELDNSDPDYDLFLTSMAVDTAHEERMTRHSKKVRSSNDEKNQSDAEATILESNKQEKNCVKLGNSDAKCNLILSAVAVNGRNEENMANHCNKVRFGEDEKNESDADVVILDLDPSSVGQRTPFVSSKAFVDECSIPNLGGKFPSEYREELIELLKKPYVEEEYIKLMKEVLRQKPVERDIDLRSGPKAFKTKIMGKSYLDLHEDFHLKIREAGSDQLKVLNILRGFFFWLQNISREGAFQPWMDPSIMNTTISHS